MEDGNGRWIVVAITTMLELPANHQETTNCRWLPKNASSEGKVLGLGARYSILWTAGPFFDCRSHLASAEMEMNKLHARPTSSSTINSGQKG